MYVDLFDELSNDYKVSDNSNKPGIEMNQHPHEDFKPLIKFILHNILAM